MVHEYGQPLQYSIHLDDEIYPINSLIGSVVTLRHNQTLQCVHCGRSIKKTFNQGSCYPCFRDLPENDLCIVKPHLCHHGDGTCRDSQFAEKHCMMPHYVYLAVSSDIKVGLTRVGNSLKRWGDQGAVQAMAIAELPTRKMAGELEVSLMEFFPDKTNWRKMLKGDVPELDLTAIRNQAVEQINETYRPYVLGDQSISLFEYPLHQSLDKVTSYNLDKQHEIEDTLIGIKGQYLLFEKGVLNMRKFAGYHLELSQ